MTRPPDASNDELTERIIGRAIEVHKELGRHQPERIYRDALAAGLEREGLDVAVEAGFDIELYGEELGTGLVDLLVEGAVVVELKAVKSTDEDHFWQLGRNVDGTCANRGLLLNFGKATLDVQRYVGES